LAAIGFGEMGRIGRQADSGQIHLGQMSGDGRLFVGVQDGGQEISATEEAKAVGPKHVKRISYFGAFLIVPIEDLRLFVCHAFADFSGVDFGLVEVRKGP